MSHKCKAGNSLVNLRVADHLVLDVRWRRRDTAVIEVDPAAVDIERTLDLRPVVFLLRELVGRGLSRVLGCTRGACDRIATKHRGGHSAGKANHEIAPAFHRGNLTRLRLMWNVIFVPRHRARGAIGPQSISSFKANDPQSPATFRDRGYDVTTFFQERRSRLARRLLVRSIRIGADDLAAGACRQCLINAELACPTPGDRLRCCCTQHLSAATLQSQNQQWIQAQEAATRSLKLNPFNHEARMPLAQCLIKLNNLSQAQTEFQTLLVQDPPGRAALEEWFAKNIPGG